MENNQRDLLILRYVKGKSTIKQDKALLEWTKESPENLKYFSDIKAIAHYLETNSRTFSNVEAPLPLKQICKRPRARIWRSFVYAAAAIAALLVIGLTVQNKKNTVNYTNNTIKRVQINLPDLTRVWLSEGSSIRYNKKTFSNKRDVKLVGEADFDVVKSGPHTFRVFTPSLEISVLGTIFNVKDFPDEDTAEATLAQGSISLMTPSGNESKRISPGQRLIYDVNTKTVRIENADVDELLYRRYGIITIEKASIHTIVDRIQTDFGVHLKADQLNSRGEDTFTFSYMEDATLDDVLFLLKSISGYHFQVE
jgi:ferric-dicitrate binding protein FerR (iron transport regulator)